MPSSAAAFAPKTRRVPDVRQWSGWLIRVGLDRKPVAVKEALGDRPWNETVKLRYKSTILHSPVSQYDYRTRS